MDTIHRMAIPLSFSMEVCLNCHDWGCTNEKRYCDITELHSFTGGCNMFMQWDIIIIIWCTWHHQNKRGGDSWAYIISCNKSWTRRGELPVFVPIIRHITISIYVLCLSDLHLYICSVKQLYYVEWEFQSLLGLCEYPVRQCACKVMERQINNMMISDNQK